MNKSLSAFRAALVTGWIALSVAGVLYARVKGIPTWAAAPVIAAFLVEYPFYLAAGFAGLRERLDGPWLPLFLIASAVLPYLAACNGAMPFAWSGLARLAAMALALGLWYVVLPASALFDLLFLALIATILLGKFFDIVYPVYHLQKLSILGHAALIQIAVMVLILQRRVQETGYGFAPNWNEWRIGAAHYVYFVVVGFPVALLLKAVHFVKPAPLWVIIGTFFGILWVVALSEEFLFRGVLQQWIEEWTASRSLALIIASVLFGLVHLGFHHFPNWRWVLLTAMLGFVCGRARNQAGGIRAGMVTHALVYTTFRAFFA